MTTFLTTVLSPWRKRHSLKAEEIFRKLGDRADSRQISTWVRSTRAVSYLGVSFGYTDVEENGKVWFGLNRILLAFPSAGFTLFVAGHEIGHLIQIRNGYSEAPRGTWALYYQEMEASSFAAQLLADFKWLGLPAAYRWRCFHSVLALQAAFPLHSLIVATPVIAAISAALQPLAAKFWECFWNVFYSIFRWIPFTNRNQRDLIRNE